jgi:hypothetical protein
MAKDHDSEQDVNVNNLVTFAPRCPLGRDGHFWPTGLGRRPR